MKSTSSRSRVMWRYRVRQYTFGSFRRTFQPPAPVNAQQARARCSNGVLRVELPKEERARGRRIEVRSG
ncbi:Hsp20/alpha crystallin family protein [Pseudomonas sp. CCI1.1]|uniref:Hsp20/alpha crystallin family protein n=2 Tax=Pseudomonas TaxID=286 RepID=UPI0029700137|nr:Hsp20/alpha crystallin family protein [Pseudomonas sp. CCI1.1]WPX50479.1 Hsp20/alpha crystallin family protein [Pseudomonas sp. CCI1.1]